MTIEGLRLRLLKIYRRIPARQRRKKLKANDFTIISNNCWGGMVYECYDLRKDSPTVGLYFMADDYVRFLSKLHFYINQKLLFIKPEQSNYYNLFKNDKDWLSYPKARLDDVEIVFMHYNSEKEARESWERRCKRIHWDNLLVKFNDQNGCRYENVKAFLDLPFDNKLFFTCKKWEGLESNKDVILLRQHDKSFITASHEPFGSNPQFNVTKYLNSHFSKR